MTPRQSIPLPDARGHRAKRPFPVAALRRASLLALVRGIDAAAEANMNAGMATQMQNAFAVPYRQVQLQTVLRAEERGAEGFRYRLEPQLLWGVAPQAFLALGTSWRIDGPAAGDERNLSIQAFRNLTPETRWLPALALMVGMEFPTGPGAAGVGSSAMGILTKTVGLAEMSLNAEIAKAAFRGDNGREFRYRVGVGFDRQLAFGRFSGEIEPVLLLRTALFLESEEEPGKGPLWTLEAGIFRDLTQVSALALGTQWRLSSGRPDAQILLSYQHAFAAR